MSFKIGKGRFWGNGRWGLLKASAGKKRLGDLVGILFCIIIIGFGNMKDTIKNLKTYEPLKSAVQSGLKWTQQIDEKINISNRYYEFPYVSQFDSGLPHFSKKILNETLIDYTTVFGKKSILTPGAIISPDEIESWVSFVEFAKQDDYLKAYFELGDLSPYSQQDKELAKLFDDGILYSIISNLVNRYVHITKSHQFNEKYFLPIYKEWEESVCSEYRFFDILVPIIFVKFSFQNCDLDENRSIERMSEELQLARNVRRSFNAPAHDCVIGAATHAFVLKNWFIENKTSRHTSEVLNDITAYSNALQVVDNFFASIRVANGTETGYSQIVIRPIDWGYSWEAYLPHIEVVSVRAFPDYFENLGWLKTPPILDEDACKNASYVFGVLDRYEFNTLRLAARRLNSAFLRKEETDSILDTTIALEAIFSDENRSEMTYKLAIRLAGLCKLEPFEEYTPLQVFDICKKVYDYRSAVVHGSESAIKKNMIKIEDKESIPAVILGIKVLRGCLQSQH